MADDGGIGEDRAARLARQLRENLKRRKAQSRAATVRADRSDDAGAAVTADAGDPAGAADAFAPTADGDALPPR